MAASIADSHGGVNCGFPLRSPWWSLMEASIAELPGCVSWWSPLALKCLGMNNQIRRPEQSRRVRGAGYPRWGWTPPARSRSWWGRCRCTGPCTNNHYTGDHTNFQNIFREAEWIGKVPTDFKAYTYTTQYVLTMCWWKYFPTHLLGQEEGSALQPGCFVYTMYVLKIQTSDLPIYENLVYCKIPVKKHFIGILTQRVSKITSRSFTTATSFKCCMEFL